MTTSPGYPSRTSSDGPNSTKGLIVVVEDEPAIADVIRINLKRAGFGVHLVARGDQALSAIHAFRPVAIVLDINLPGVDGIEICRTLRQNADWTPIVFVTARADEVDRIIGLELGGDDYLTKPFSPRELVARLNGVLRRRQGVPEMSVLHIGSVRIDPSSRRVWVDETEISLTLTEFELLAYLARRPGRVCEREQLLSAVWGYSTAGGTRTVDVHIAQLRAKLGVASPIRTIRGIGYAAEPGREASSS